MGLIWIEHQFQSACKLLSDCMQNISARLNSKVLLSIATIFAAAAIVLGATFAFFSDTETSKDNTFVAGALDLKVNGEDDPSQIVNITDLKPGDDYLIDKTLLVPGDIVFFDWNNDKRYDHCGIFIQDKLKYFQSIEGNTSYANNSNGGAVIFRVRKFINVLFVHPIINL